MKIEDAEKHIKGIGCQCGAWNQGECGCDADWTPKLEHIVNAWKEMTSRELSIHCGYILDLDEIKTIRVVIDSMLKSVEYRPTRQEHCDTLLKWEMDHLNDDLEDTNNGLDINPES
jgi:hypothetical protein